jgi:hypothetical protein
MHVIELDARRRTSFGRVGRKEHTRYIVEERQDGTMLLTPAVVVPATLPIEWIESLRLGVAEAQAGKTRPAREVFAELGIDLDADDD